MLHIFRTRSTMSTVSTVYFMIQCMGYLMSSRYIRLSYNYFQTSSSSSCRIWSTTWSLPASKLPNILRPYWRSLWNWSHNAGSKTQVQAFLQTISVIILPFRRYWLLEVHKDNFPELYWPVLGHHLTMCKGWESQVRLLWRAQIMPSRCLKLPGHKNVIE